MTISNEIIRIKNNVKNVYDALEAKGVTLPETKTTDNIVATMNGEFGGVSLEVVNNQDKTITENGQYTADEGYSGLGTITVNVSSSGPSSGNIYDKNLAEQYLSNLVNNSYKNACKELSGSTLNTQLTGQWEYKPSDFVEQLEDILYAYHNKAYKILNTF